jgi:predicted Zn-dependent peptidase
VASRADELCRYAVLFGDPQLAFTAVGRILAITAAEVQSVAAARLRPDNRVVLEYEPLSADAGADGAGSSDSAEQEGAGR